MSRCSQVVSVLQFSWKLRHFQDGVTHWSWWWWWWWWQPDPGVLTGFVGYRAGCAGLGSKGQGREATAAWIPGQLSPFGWMALCKVTGLGISSKPTCVGCSCCLVFSSFFLFLYPPLLMHHPPTPIQTDTHAHSLSLCLCLSLSLSLFSLSHTHTHTRIHTHLVLLLSTIIYLFIFKV